MFRMRAGWLMEFVILMACRVMTNEKTRFGQIEIFFQSAGKTVPIFIVSKRYEISRDFKDNCIGFRLAFSMVSLTNL
jgi:hypothetical protein